MSDDEVKVLIDKLSISRLEDRDSQEVAGYFNALDIISDSYEEMGVTESTIKSLHNILMKHSRKDEWHKGNYRMEIALSNSWRAAVICCLNIREHGHESRDKEQSYYLPDILLFTKAISCRYVWEKFFTAARVKSRLLKRWHYGTMMLKMLGFHRLKPLPRLSNITIWVSSIFSITGPPMQRLSHLMPRLKRSGM